MAIITVSLSPAIDVTLATEHLHVGTHQPVKLLAQSAAGKAINVSRALAAMSIPSTATGFVGSTEADFFSRQLMTDRPGGRSIIRNRLISLDQPTRQNITILSAEGETHLRMDGFNLGELEMRRLAGEIKAVASHGDMMVVTGLTAQHCVKSQPRQGAGGLPLFACGHIDAKAYISYLIVFREEKGSRCGAKVLLCAYFPECEAADCRRRVGL